MLVDCIELFRDLRQRSTVRNRGSDTLLRKMTLRLPVCGVVQYLTEQFRRSAPRELRRVLDILCLMTGSE
jgi:hypothetical protein